MRPIRVLLALTATALVAAACGDDSTTGSGTPAQASGSSSSSPSAAASSSGGDLASLPATEILSKAKTAFKGVESVRLTGGGTDGSETFQIDMRYGPDKAIGTVSNSGQKIELRRIGKTVYLKADKAFWTQTAGAQAAAVLGDKYLKAPLTDQRVASLASFTDKDQFVNEVLSSEGTVTKGETKTIRGTEAVGLVDKAGDDGGTLYIATTGEPLPLQLTPEGSTGGTGSLDFLDYGKSFDVAIPPAAQTIDVTKLGGN